MSVGSVTSSSLQRDLISALRQTRGASAQQTDASAFAVPSDGASPSAGTAATTASGSTASSPGLSNDLMASLLKVQSDFSQISAQGGFAAPASAQSITEASSDGSDGGQSQGDAAPAHRQHGHHTRAAGPDGSGSAASSSAAVAANSGAATGETDASGGIQDGLQALLQQVTKAIAAYTAAGPVGLAASALSTTSKT
jgi:hypothetical protein